MFVLVKVALGHFDFLKNSSLVDEKWIDSCRGVFSQVLLGRMMRAINAQLLTTLFPFFTSSTVYRIHTGLYIVVYSMCVNFYTFALHMGPFGGRQ